GLTVSVLTKDGQSVEGIAPATRLRAMVDGKEREIALADVLSIQTGGAASSRETERINADLLLVGGPDRKASDAAVAEITEIGIPALTPVLASYKDTDLHQPNPLYRLFQRIVPGYADEANRSLGLIRLADG